MGTIGEEKQQNGRIAALETHTNSTTLMIRTILAIFVQSAFIPQSVEKDIASTAISFGFNTVLSATIEMLNKAYQAARSAREVAVVEVLGEQAGWIALQADIAIRLRFLGGFLFILSCNNTIWSRHAHAHYMKHSVCA